jgi:long-chain acyl-CoA synthetase
MRTGERADVLHILGALPRRIPRAIAGLSDGLQDREPLVDDGESSRSYGELKRAVGELTFELRSRGLRAGERMMVVSDNCIGLAALLRQPRLTHRQPSGIPVYRCVN